MLVSCPGQRSGDGELESLSSPPTSHEVEPRRSESRLRSLMRDELLINVQKFATQVPGIIITCMFCTVVPYGWYDHSVGQIDWISLTFIYC